jgi:hypothetical protein
MAPPDRNEYGNKRIGGDLFKYTCLSKFHTLMVNVETSIINVLC